MERAIQRLKEQLAQIDGLRRATAVMSWDEDTHMPTAGAASRARALGAVSRTAHELATSPDFARTLQEAEGEGQRLPPESDDGALLRVVRREFERSVKLPAPFVAELRESSSRAGRAWQQARPANDFAAFAPHLQAMIELQRRKAELLGYAEHPYDALLEGYEPGMRTAQVQGIFAELRERTVPLRQAIAARGAAVDDSPLHQPFDEAQQWALAHEVVALFGYDFQAGRIDRSAHPYCTTFGAGDVRMTLRTSPTFFNTCFFAACHECGHALYNLGLPAALADTPLFRGASAMVHESQSRLWENLIGRSLPFWRFFFPAVQARFPQQLGALSVEQFYRAINRSRPSLNRVEADEVTYNLHIMLRFELELAMLEGTVNAADLPSLWAEKMESYLGVVPPSDAEGVMQDMHWGSGLFGYFPTYALGNVLAAQLWESATRTMPDLPQQLEGGHFESILGWMRDKVHQHAFKLLPDALILRATGAPLSADSYVRYLDEKFGAIYGLNG